MRVVAIIAVAALVLACSACTHLKGVVLEDPSGRPLHTAIFSVGRPGGIAVYETHPVNAKGEFDFSVLPMDANDVYLYDGATDPEMTVRHVDESEMNDHMQMHMRRAHPNPMVPTDINIDQ